MKSFSTLDSSRQTSETLRKQGKANTLIGCAQKKDQTDGGSDRKLMDIKKEML